MLVPRWSIEALADDERCPHSIGLHSRLENEGCLGCTCLRAGTRPLGGQASSSTVSAAESRSEAAESHA